VRWNWRGRTLRVRLALWYATVGLAIQVLTVMVALMSRVWIPGSRLDVVLTLFVFMPAAACALAAAGYFVAGRALAPIANMATRARRLSARSLSERLPVSDPASEIGQLAVVFNEILDRLESSFAELRSFAADASHELRTPLTAIRTVGEVALRQEDPNTLRDTVGSMLEEAARMNELIERLLLLARADHEMVPLRLEPIALREMALDVADSLSVVANEKSQTVDTRELQDIVAVADAGLLRLALMNLIHNAIRYSPPGKSIRLGTAAVATDAVIEVSDEGPGIAREHQPRIFDRFYRVDKSRSRADGGTGLGLAIVKWAAERMNGSVAVESELGRGSLFRIRLPLVSSASARESYDEAAGQEPSEPLLEVFEDASEGARGAVDEVLARLRTGPDGLRWSEAARRLARFGPNEVATNERTSWPALLWHAARNPFNGILVLLGIVWLLTADFEAAVVMGVMISLSTGLRFWQEWRSQVQAESLRKLVRNKVTVWRTADGVTTHDERGALDQRATDIPLEHLVPGDIVLLSAGDVIPGDLRLLESRDLFVAQAALTGETMPVEKGTGRTYGSEGASSGTHEKASLLDQPDLLFMGSSVISGTGKAVVLATGRHTYFGATAWKLVGRNPPTAFDRGVNDVSWLLIRFMLVMVPIVFFINGLSKGQWMDAFFFAVAVAVGLTPEMLPVIVNANLARGAVEMSGHKVIVKRLNAIQSLGAMDILCTDKTGTLTQDHVALIDYLDSSGHGSLRVLEHAYLNSLFQTGLRNLLDRAIVERAVNVGLRQLAHSFVKIDEIPFDFNRRRMSVVLRHTSGIDLLICKGAVEEMLQICSQMENETGVIALTGELREQLKRLRDRLNEDGMRVVAVAFRALAPGDSAFSVADESELIFSGFVAFLDPAKDTAPEALRLLGEHGISVKILTGDNAAVARRICRDVGLDPQRIVIGSEIEHLTDDALGDLAEQTTVFAKVSPLQKSQIVRALKRRNHTVGFMGDGINDATALREADIGISVDSGVDIAKETADVILLEKSLLVLEHGVVAGRRTFGNIVKYIKMAGSSNFGNVLSVLIASAALPFLPMSAIQLLVQNLLYDVSQVAIPWDRVDEEFVKRPRQWDSRGIATFMLCLGPVSSIFDIVAFLVLWFIFKANAPAAESLFQSGWFVEGLLTQTLIVHMIRTEKIPFVQSTAALPVLLLTVVVTACGIWLPYSPLAPALSLQALPTAYLAWVGAILLAYCVLTQFVKVAYMRRFGSWL
jgi:Mg2+-importing ATPase